uniref:transposase n=1 Tax=Aliarcobacter butzleri TaxID=28197 RepID=UPI002B246919
MSGCKSAGCPNCSGVCNKVKQWQIRPLDSIYPFVWLDAIHYKIKDGGKYVSKA